MNIPIVNDGVLEGPQFFFGDLTTTFVDVILNPDETQIIIADIDSKFHYGQGENQFYQQVQV